jgi:methyl-accepting chemotaxis protein
MNLGTEGGAPSVVSGATAPQSEPGSAADTNRSLDTLERVLGEISGAARMTEGTFVGIGQRLEASINTIDGLTTTFKTLMEELGSDELVRATADLSQVSTRIGALAHAPRDSEAVLGKITSLTDAMTGRVGRMRKAVQAVDVLAVNAKIAAAHLGSSGEGFSTFAEEITRAMKVAEENLDGFAEQLALMSERLKAATSSQRALAKQRDQAIRTIPDQLARSVSAIAGRRRQAENTAAAIQRKTVEVGQRVGTAVMAMQIGDTSRQRIEHSEFALTLAARLFGRDTRSAVDFDLSAVPAAKKHRLLEAIAALSLAQLTDTAEELDTQVGEIAASLSSLAGDAHEIAGLGQQTYSSDGAEAGSFMSELEEDVRHARGLLEDLRNAQTEGDGVMAGVVETTRALVRNISAIQSLESDIRLMGLNTTLRSSRLGNEGRALTVIAQELRICSNLTATEAEAVLADLDAMVEAAGASSGVDPERRLAEITDLTSILVRSVERLSKTADSLSTALETLDRESEAVAASLRQTSTEIRAKAEIGATLRRASTALSGVQGDAPIDEEMGDPGAVFAAIFGKYTMAREREVHARVLKCELPAVAEAPAAGADDDIFF